MYRLLLNLYESSVKHKWTFAPISKSDWWSSLWLSNYLSPWPERESERDEEGREGENTGCQHVSVLDWECRWSRGIRRFLSLAFTECALNELINIHWPALAYVPGDGQNKVAEVTHFTRREREVGRSRERMSDAERKWAGMIRECRFQTKWEQREANTKRAKPLGPWGMREFIMP